MLSDNELERIKNHEETDRLALNERNNDIIKAETAVKQEKERQEKSAKSVEKVILITMIVIGVVFSLSLIILTFQMWR